MRTETPRIELVYFTGCPNVADARSRIKTALSVRRLPQEWDEWDQLEVDTPQRMRRYGSPTVLVNDHDVTGTEPANGMACRMDGAPSVNQIVRALER